MRSKIGSYVTFTFLLFVATAVAHAQKVELKGGIFSDRGPSNFQMSIDRHGSDLRGSYYYLRSGSLHPLTLSGTIGPDGAFTMKEFDSSGTNTGEFKGKWSDGPDEPGVSIEGNWTKAGGTEAKGFWAEEQMIRLTGGARLTSAEMKDTLKAKRAEMSGEYPQVSGVPNAGGFNALSKARFMSEINAFRKLAAGLTADDLKSMPAEMNYYIGIGYSVSYADNDLISISFSTDEFTGGVHGNQGFFTLTYDLKNGRELRLGDLFKPGARYLTTVADYAAKNLRARKDPDSGENMGLAQDIFEDGVKPTVSNFKNWTLTEKGLMFDFPPYQVAAYAYGPQTVIIPYSQLSRIAAAGSPILTFAK